MAGEEGERVQLWVYDLSGGMARTFSPMLLGRQIEAIYHTSVVVGGTEHYFGGGINVATAGHTPFGHPIEKLDLGVTHIPRDVREEFLCDLAERYTPQSYSLFHNNCNNFSDELAQLLVGRGIPSHITGLPSEVLATPFGQMIAPMLSGLETQMRGMQQQAFQPQPHPAAPALAAPAAAPALGAPAAAAAAAALPAAQPRLVNGPGAVQAPAAADAAQEEEEGPALVAAEVEIEAAIAGGMLQEVESQLDGLQVQPQAPGSSGEPAAGASATGDGGGAGAPAGAADTAATAGGAGPPAAAAAAAAEKRAVEGAVRAQYERLMAEGELGVHEAQARALELVAATLQQQQQQAHEGGSSTKG